MDAADSKRTKQAAALAELLLADISDPVGVNEALTVASWALGNIIVAMVRPEHHDLILTRVQGNLRSQLALGVRLAGHGPASFAPEGRA